MGSTCFVQASGVALAALLEQVAFPAFGTVWVDVFRAEGAPDSAGWVGRCTLMSFKFIHHEHLLTLGVVFVFAHVSALLQQVLLNHLDLDNLVALPAAGQDRALLPVVDIK